MKIQLMSDVHLGFGILPIENTDADVVVLAGDIGRPRQAIPWAYQFAKPVVYVPGNHEFYGGILDGTMAELRGMAESTPIRVLDEDEVVIGGVRFLGTTLWTDMKLYGEGADRDLAMRAAWQTMRDFQLIKVSGKKLFTPFEMVNRFQRNHGWLQKKLAERSDLPTVVVTHHAPSRRSIHPRLADQPINAAYVSDLESLIASSGASLWIHGHTHQSFDYSVNGTRVLCNPRGYFLDGVTQNRKFDPAMVVEIA